MYCQGLAIFATYPNILNLTIHLWFSNVFIFKGHISFPCRWYLGIFNFSWNFTWDRSCFCEDGHDMQLYSMWCFQSVWFKATSIHVFLYIIHAGSSYKRHCCTMSLMLRWWQYSNHDLRKTITLFWQQPCRRHTGSVSFAAESMVQWCRSHSSVVQKGSLMQSW